MTFADNRVGLRRSEQTCCGFFESRARGVVPPASSTACIDAYLAHIKTHGYDDALDEKYPLEMWRRTDDPISPYGVDKGVAAFGRAIGRSEADVHATFVRLCELFRDAEKSLGWLAQGARFPEEPWRIIDLLTLKGTAEELFATYTYTADRLRTLGLCAFRHAISTEVMRVLERAAGMRDHDRWFDGRCLDKNGKLLPDRSDKVWLSMVVPNDALDVLEAHAKQKGYELTAERSPPGYLGNNAMLGVPHEVDRAALKAALEGVAASICGSGYYWLEDGSSP